MPFVSHGGAISSSGWNPERSAPRARTPLIGTCVAACVAALAIALPAPLPAQVWGAASDGQPTRTRPELRLDVLAADATAVHFGAGISFPAGTYVRIGAAAGGGPAWDGGATDWSGRFDVTARFLLDPAGQSRRGFSLGAGLGLRHDGGETRAVAIVLADLEGSRRSGWVPFGQVGLGGGARITAGFRRGVRQGR